MKKQANAKRRSLEFIEGDEALNKLTPFGSTLWAIAEVRRAVHREDGGQDGLQIVAAY